MNRKIYLIGGAIIAVIALVFAYVSQKGTLRVEINTLSPVKDGVEVYIAKKQYPKPFQAPFSLELRPGHYQLIAIAPDASQLTEDFTIQVGRTTALSLTLTKDTAAVDQEEITPTTDELANNALLHLFPHTETDFTVSATFTRDSAGEIAVKSVTITPFLPIPAGDNYDRDEVLRAKAAYVSEAKQWLKDNGIAEDIPTIIDSVI